MSEQKERKKRFENSPAWVIASLTGALMWFVVAVIGAVFFEVALSTALVFGSIAGAMIAAPAMASEAIGGFFAMVLEVMAQGAVLVLMFPLLLIGSCGV